MPTAATGRGVSISRVLGNEQHRNASVWRGCGLCQGPPGAPGLLLRSRSSEEDPDMIPGRADHNHQGQIIPAVDGSSPVACNGHGFSWK